MKRGTRLGVGESRGVVLGLGVVAWVVGLLWIFPVAWTVLTSFKTEDDASAQTLHHGLTLHRYSDTEIVARAAALRPDIQLQPLKDPRRKTNERDVA